VQHLVTASVSLEYRIGAIPKLAPILKNLKIQFFIYP